MKHMRTAAVVLGALLTVTAVGFASQSTATPAKASAKKAAAPTMAMHATSGVVKSLTDTSLVIAKSATKGPETTFVVNASTQKEGNVAVGSMVDVRYHAEGKEKIASAVSVHEAKAKKS